MEEPRFSDIPSTPKLALLDNEELFKTISCSDFLNFSFAGKSYVDQLKAAQQKSGKFCGVTCVLRNLNGIHCLWISHAWDFIGGSLGCAEGEKICLGLEYAREHRIPVVLETRSGGVRMQEGTLALMQMARVSCAVRAFKATKIPFITVCKNPTYGGTTASYAMQGDIRIGVADARVGFAGPNVILNTIYKMNQEEYDRKCPTGFQTAEFLLQHGQLDMVCADDDDVRNRVTNLLFLFYCARKVSSEKRKARHGHKHKAAKTGEHPTSWPDLQEEQTGTPVPRSPGTDFVPGDEVFSAPPSPQPMEVVPDLKLDRDYTRSRAQDRYQSLDIIEQMFSQFIDLSGDGKVGSDMCLHGGLAQLDSQAVVMVIATLKGHTEEDMQKHNYGMASPHGYRTALRLMNLAERFEIPVVTLVDTPGAFPTFSSEQEGQAEAIATNLERMSGLNVPIVTIVVGEGGSGGALGIAVGDRIGMLSRAYYTVISPEGASSILGRYKDEEHKRAQFPKDCAEIAKTQRIYAPDLLELKVIDEIIWEESDIQGVVEQVENCTHMPMLLARLKAFIVKSLAELAQVSTKDMVVRRYLKFREMGKSGEVTDEEAEELRVQKEGKPAAPRPLPPPVRQLPPSAAKLLSFVADQTINAANAAYSGKMPSGIQVPRALPATAPFVPENPEMTPKWILDHHGPAAVVDWMRSVAKDRVLITDTTFRDAHQSLLATRVRTADMLGASFETSKSLADAFSLEMWGGATFDVAFRFLHEDPWDRLRLLRQRIPNIMFQMLLRGSNAVGYTSYPDNVIRKFVELAAKNGIDVFRVFDCFNSLEQMEVSIDAVKKAGKICEVGICFSGNFLSPEEKIYSLDYYKNLVRKLVDMGVHIIGIKDMAGLVRPQMAAPLIAAIREVTDLPIHFHTHNTSSAALTTCLNMANCGCNVIDLAISALSDVTAQPNLNAFCAAMEGHPRDPKIDYLSLEPLAMYWDSVRRVYSPFESGLQTGTPRVYEHQIPGGQYSNLFAQCKSMGNWDKWETVLDTYRDVNKMLGDIIKVTPSSKVVGDLALFMISKGLHVSDIIEHGEDYQYPASVVDLFSGRMGYPHHGLPPLKVLPKGVAPMVGRPGKNLPSVDFEAERGRLAKQFMKPISDEELISSLLYTKVFADYQKFIDAFGDLTYWLPSHVFFYGMPVNGALTLDIPPELLPQSEDAMAVDSPQPNQISIVLNRVGPLLRDNMRTVVFRVNGIKRETTVADKSSTKVKVIGGRKADANDRRQIGASIPGSVEKVFVVEGDKVHKGDKVVTISAMKMEVILASPFNGIVSEVVAKQGDQVHVGNLLVVVEPSEV